MEKFRVSCVEFEEFFYFEMEMPDKSTYDEIWEKARNIASGWGAYVIEIKNLSTNRKVKQQ